MSASAITEAISHDKAMAVVTYQATLLTMLKSSEFFRNLMSFPEIKAAWSSLDAQIVAQLRPDGADVVGRVACGRIGAASRCGNNRTSDCKFTGPSAETTHS